MDNRIDPSIRTWNPHLCLKVFISHKKWRIGTITLMFLGEIVWYGLNYSPYACDYGWGGCWFWSQLKGKYCDVARWVYRVFLVDRMRNVDIIIHVVSGRVVSTERCLSWWEASRVKYPNHLRTWYFGRLELRRSTMVHPHNIYIHSRKPYVCLTTAAAWSKSLS